MLCASAFTAADYAKTGAFVNKTYKWGYFPLMREYDSWGMAISGKTRQYKKDKSHPFIVRDNNKCILCRRCVAACNEQYVGVIGANNRGIDTNIGTPFEIGLANVPCISCGQCTVVCPTGALVEKDDTDKVWAAISDPEKYLYASADPDGILTNLIQSQQ